MLPFLEGNSSLEDVTLQYLQFAVQQQILLLELNQLSFC